MVVNPKRPPSLQNNHFRTIMATTIGTTMPVLHVIVAAQATITYMYKGSTKVHNKYVSVYINSWVVKQSFP